VNEEPGGIELKVLISGSGLNFHSAPLSLRSGVETGKEFWRVQVNQAF